jgi:hypothetical protein
MIVDHPTDAELILKVPVIVAPCLVGHGHLNLTDFRQRGKKQVGVYRNKKIAKAVEISNLCHIPRGF